MYTNPCLCLETDYGFLIELIPNLFMEIISIVLYKYGISTAWLTIAVECADLLK